MNGVSMTWDGASLTVSRTNDGNVVEIREFTQDQYPRAQELFVELSTDRCGASFRAPHPTRAESDEAGETASALVESVGLLVRVVNEAKLPDPLADEIEDFVDRVSGDEVDNDE